MTPKQSEVVAVKDFLSRLVMTPREPITVVTITMPASPVHGQLFHVSAVGRGVSGIKWLGNVIGGPTAIAAAHTSIFEYNGETREWLCVQE